MSAPKPKSQKMDSLLQRMSTASSMLQADDDISFGLGEPLADESVSEHNDNEEGGQRSQSENLQM